VIHNNWTGIAVTRNVVWWKDSQLVFEHSVLLCSKLSVQSAQPTLMTDTELQCTLLHHWTTHHRPPPSYTTLNTPYSSSPPRPCRTPCTISTPHRTTNPDGLTLQPTHTTIKTTPSADHSNTVRPEVLRQLKFPTISSGGKTTIFRLLVYCLSL
jgi:hypothetical protein